MMLLPSGEANAWAAMSDAMVLLLCFDYLAVE